MSRLGLAGARAGQTVSPRGRRLRAPLLLILWALLSIEAVGGLVIFFARLAAGSMPGETLHVAAGALLTLAYGVYQVQHWSRVAPWRSRLDYALGLIGACAMGITLASGLALAWPWWVARGAASGGAALYPAALIALHNIMSMLVLTFVLSHLAAVLRRDAAARLRGE